MIHPFEKAGLGKAPFTCVGVHENVYVTAGGAHKQPGGCCNYCGTGIQYEYEIVSADGAKFVVGSDCVARVGDVAEFRETRLKFARDRRAMKAQVRRAIRQAVWDKEREERKANWKIANKATADKVTDYDGSNEYLISMKLFALENGYITNNMADAIERTFEFEERKELIRQRSKHIGNEGERFKKVMAKITASKLIGYNEFYYPPVPRVLVKLETESGDQLVWWTSRGYQIDEEFAPVSFTVKGHDEYDGVKQTIVTRVKAH